MIGIRGPDPKLVEIQGSLCIDCVGIGIRTLDNKHLGLILKALWGRDILFVLCKKNVLSTVGSRSMTEAPRCSDNTNANNSH